MKNKNSHEMPEKFGIYKRFAVLFPFLTAKKFIDTITKQGKPAQYQQFLAYLKGDINSLSLDNLPNLNSIEFSENETSYSVTVTKLKQRSYDTFSV